MRLDRLGYLQITGLVIYVFDPIFADTLDGDDRRFPGSLDADARALVVDEGQEERAAGLLTDAANSADDDHDGPVRDALTTLASRMWRAVSAPGSPPAGPRAGCPVRA